MYWRWCAAEIYAFSLGKMPRRNILYARLKQINNWKISEKCWRDTNSWRCGEEFCMRYIKLEFIMHNNLALIQASLYYPCRHDFNIYIHISISVLDLQITYKHQHKQPNSLPKPKRNTAYKRLKRKKRPQIQKSKSQWHSCHVTPEQN